MARVEVLDHTADIGLRVTAAAPAEVFTAAAEAMADIIVSRVEIGERSSWEIEVSATGWPDLLVAWLEEVLYRYEVEGLTPVRVEIEDLDSQHLRATLHGDVVDPERDEPGVQIKAVTYHQLVARETADGFEIQVIFDI